MRNKGITYKELCNEINKLQSMYAQSLSHWTSRFEDFLIKHDLYYILTVRYNDTDIVSNKDKAKYFGFKKELIDTVSLITKYSTDRYMRFEDYAGSLEVIVKIFKSEFEEAIEKVIDLIDNSGEKLDSSVLIFARLETYSFEEMNIWDKIELNHPGISINALKMFTLLLIVWFKKQISDIILDMYTRANVEMEDSKSISKIIGIIGHGSIARIVDYDPNDKNQWPFNDESIIDLILRKIQEFDLSENILKKLSLIGVDDYKDIDVEKLELILEVEKILKTIKDKYKISIH